MGFHVWCDPGFKGSEPGSEVSSAAAAPLALTMMADLGGTGVGQAKRCTALFGAECLTLCFPH